MEHWGQKSVLNALCDHEPIFLYGPQFPHESKELNEMISKVLSTRYSGVPHHRFLWEAGRIVFVLTWTLVYV